MMKKFAAVVISLIAFCLCTNVAFAEEPNVTPEPEKVHFEEYVDASEEPNVTLEATDNVHSNEDPQQAKEMVRGTRFNFEEISMLKPSEQLSLLFKKGGMLNTEYREIDGKPYIFIDVKAPDPEIDEANAECDCRYFIQVDGITYYFLHGSIQEMYFMIPTSC